MGKPKPEAELPDCERGDEVYFRGPRGPLTGKVASRGAHGVTVECEGKRHQVRWEDLHGHKVRVRPECKVVDQGEDGVIVEDKSGQRRFLRDEMGAEAPTVTKSFRPAVLLLGEPEALLKAARRGEPKRKVQPTPKRKVGDRVVFSHATGVSQGEIVGQPGEHGAHIRTDDGATHQVLWSAMRDLSAPKKAAPADGEAAA